MSLIRRYTRKGRHAARAGQFCYQPVTLCSHDLIRCVCSQVYL